MDVRPLDPHDEVAVAEAADVITASDAADAPWQWPTTAKQLRGVLLHGFDLEAPIPFAGYDGRRLVARGALHLTEWDNRDVGWWEIQVHPSYRGLGHGTAMLRHLEKVGTEAGRSSFGTDAWDGTPGVAFAGCHGYERRSAAILRRQHLAELDRDALTALHCEASTAAREYELMRVAAVPEELEPFAELAASINDAPLDDQHDTAVARRHRGHKLGLLVKTELLDWLFQDEPRLLTVDTWNAESNHHMIAVNEALGYRWTARELAFQK